MERCRVFGGYVVRNTASTSRFAINGNVIRIASERRDVAIDPLESNLLIIETKVSYAFLTMALHISLDCCRRQKTSQTNAIVEVDGNHRSVALSSIGCQIYTIENSLIRASEKKGATMDVQH